MLIRRLVHNYVSAKCSSWRVFVWNDEWGIKNMDQFEFLKRGTHFRENVDESVTKRMWEIILILSIEFKKMASVGIF